MAMSGCRHFIGDRPCALNPACNEACPHLSVPSQHLLIVHLGALGAVLRSTALLEPIKEKFPDSHITWVTEAPAHRLLKHIKSIDKVMTLDTKDLLSLSFREFDVGFVIDKSPVAFGLARSARCKKIFGFKCDSISGAVLPATHAAQELWEIGLSNEKKFFQNVKTENELVAEALELSYKKSEYIVSFSDEEKRDLIQRKKKWAPHKEIIVGLNTGCSSVIPNKKLTVERHRELISKLNKIPNIKIVLLGGPEDSLRNQQIAYGLNVIESSTHKGLRDGLVSVGACDVIVSGDSLGMHMGIALKKWMVVWFGPTCAHEIELYERGVKILTQAQCSPCWKRNCTKEVMCYDLVNLDSVVEGVKMGIEKLDKANSNMIDVTL